MSHEKWDDLSTIKNCTYQENYSLESILISTLKRMTNATFQSEPCMLTIMVKEQRSLLLSQVYPGILLLSSKLFTIPDSLKSELTTNGLFVKISIGLKLSLHPSEER